MKVVSLVLLVISAFTVIANVIMASNAQLPSKVITLRVVGYNDNSGYQPLGDPVDGPISPSSNPPP